MIVRANLVLDATAAQLLKARLTGERIGHMEAVALGARPAIIAWVHVDELALVLFMDWNAVRRAGSRVNNHDPIPLPARAGGIA